MSSSPSAEYGPRGRRDVLPAPPAKMSFPVVARRSAFLLLALLFIAGVSLGEDKPKLNGAWQLDASKSKVEHSGETIELNIQVAKDKIDLTRTIRAADGKEAVSKFECVAGGPDCPFDEAGHKSKVSLWFQGDDLVILKTDGSGSDEVSQWTLKLVDPNTMQVTVSHITPPGADETMVFARQKSTT